MPRAGWKFDAQHRIIEGYISCMVCGREVIITKADIEKALQNNETTVVCQCGKNSILVTAYGRLGMRQKCH